MSLDRTEMYPYSISYRVIPMGVERQKMEASVKTKLETIQKTLAHLDLESGPAHLARIFGVAQSSIFRWLNNEVQSRGKQAERIDLLYRTACEVEAGNPQAEEILKNLVSPLSVLGLAAGANSVPRAGVGLMAGTNLLSFGLLGAVAAAGLGWLLTNREDKDEE